MKFVFFILITLVSLSSLASEEDKSQFPSYDMVNGIILDQNDEVFSAHQPNYIISGADDLKLQFSFRYRLLKKSHLFFGYSQQMYWDVYADSKPFYDINFKPEVFYRFLIKDELLKSVDTGVLHHSNGKAGIESRSLNQIYTNFNFIGHNNSYVNFASSIQAFYTFDKEATNENIVNYIGYYKIHFGLMDIFGHESRNVDLGVSFFAGNHLINFDKGAMEVNLKFSFLKKYLNPDVLFQYYHGYAQNLMDYEKSVDHFRLGFMFYL